MSQPPRLAVFRLWGRTRHCGAVYRRFGFANSFFSSQHRRFSFIMGGGNIHAYAATGLCTRPSGKFRVFAIGLIAPSCAEGGYILLNGIRLHYLS